MLGSKPSFPLYAPYKLPLLSRIFLYIRLSSCSLPQLAPYAFDQMPKPDSVLPVDLPGALERSDNSPKSIVLATEPSV